MNRPSPKIPTPSATLTLTCLETLDCLHRFHKVPTFQPTHKTLHRLQSRWSRRYPERDHSDVFKNLVAKLLVSACFSQFLLLVDAFSAANVEEKSWMLFRATYDISPTCMVGSCWGPISLLHHLFQLLEDGNFAIVFPLTFVGDRWIWLPKI